jgi:hypothetical protein
MARAYPAGQEGSGTPADHRVGILHPIDTPDPTMPDRRAHARDGEMQMPWLRIFALTLFGGVMLIIISLPGLASESQSSASAGTLVAVLVVFAAVDRLVRDAALADALRSG